MIDEPMMTFCKCLSCGHKWTAFCPDGHDDDSPFECPCCSRIQGVPIDAPIYSFGDFSESNGLGRLAIACVGVVFAFIFFAGVVIGVIFR